MSLLGQKAKFRVDQRMSAFASKADIPSLISRTLSRWWHAPPAARDISRDVGAGVLL